MNVPFILGNDFTGQYQLSIVREPNGTYVHFGNTGRKILAKESASTPRTDEAGNVFHVST